MTVLTFLLCSVASAQPAVYSGFIVDFETGERLPSVIVLSLRAQKAVVSNSEGFFVLNALGESDTLQFRMMGYEILNKPVKSLANPPVFIRLVPQPIQSEAIEVVGRGYAMGKASASVVRFSPAELAGIPSFVGHADVLKSVQYLPGVQAGNEGTAQVFVRGGSHDQTLILLDGVPVFNAFHSSGFITAFHPGILNHGEFLSGGFHARYGGRLSGVLDLGIKEGNHQKFSGDANYGILSADILAEVPIVPQRSSLILAARTSTYPDKMNELSLFDNKGLIPTTDFYDITAKFTHHLSGGRKWTAMLFTASDRMGSKFESQGWDSTQVPYPRYQMLLQDNASSWHTTLASIQYQLPLGQQALVKFTGYLTSYKVVQEELSQTTSIEKYTGEFRYEMLSSFELTNGVNQGCVGADLVTGLNNRWSAEAGSRLSTTGFASTQRALLVTEDMRYGSDSTGNVSPVSRTLEWENYGALSYKSGLLDMNVGLRSHMLYISGTAYGSIQPRLNVGVALGPRVSLAASVSYMQQMMHLLSNSGAGVAVEWWIPPEEGIRPAKGWIGVLGTRYLPASSFEASFEMYYRDMKHLAEFRQGAHFYSTTQDWQDLVTQGSGTAYGMEFMLRKTRGRWTGGVSYSLSRSDRTFADLNRGKTYSFKYDRRYNVSGYTNVRVFRWLDAQFAYVYFGGARLTVPSYEFTADIWSLYPGGSPLSTELAYYSFRNNYQLPAYHRLDVSFTTRMKMQGASMQVKWGVYNAYNRSNAVFGTYAGEYGLPGIRHVPMYPLIPFVSVGVTW